MGFIDRSGDIKDTTQAAATPDIQESSLPFTPMPSVKDVQGELRAELSVPTRTVRAIRDQIQDYPSTLLSIATKITELKADIEQAYQQATEDATATLSRIEKVSQRDSLYPTATVEFSDGNRLDIEIATPEAQGMLKLAIEDYAKKSEQHAIVAVELENQIDSEANIQFIEDQHQRSAQIYSGAEITLTNGKTYKIAQEEIVATGKATDQGGLSVPFIIRPELKGIKLEDLEQSARREACMALTTYELHQFLHGFFDSSRTPESMFVDGDTVTHTHVLNVPEEKHNGNSIPQLGELMRRIAWRTPRLDALPGVIAEKREEVEDRGEEILPLFDEIERASIALSPIGKWIPNSDSRKILISATLAGIDPDIENGILQGVPAFGRPWARDFIRHGKVPLAAKLFLKANNIDLDTKNLIKISKP